MRIKLLLLTFILVGTCLGQPPQREGRMNPQNMDAIRIWKLTEVLELTEDQVVSFLPLVQIHERKLKKIQTELIALAKEGHALMEKGDVSQKQVDKFMKKYVAKQAEVHKIKNDFINSLPNSQYLGCIGMEMSIRPNLVNSDEWKDKWVSGGDDDDLEKFGEPVWLWEKT